MKRIAIGAALATLVAMVVKRLRPDDVHGRVRPDLAELTKDELYQRAQVADIPGRSQMSKDELIAALERI